MDTPPPPPPVHYPTSLSPPSMTTTRTDNRLNQASFSSPLAARFSPQMSPQNQLPLPLSRSTGSLDTRNGLSSSSPPIQFSTPPGPPIFSSPLQPAAVPFRTSPTSPQPLAFSTSSTIPTFSPSNFTNGTATIPLPDTTDVVEAVEAPYVLFSSLKVLKRKKQANASSLGFGALVSLGREITPGPHVVQRDAHRCQNCGAYASSYSDVSIDSGKWKCVICKKLNSSDGEFVAARKEDLHHWPELSFSIIDYVHSGNRRPGYVPVSDSRMSAPVFLVIDECLDEAHIQHLQGSLHAFVDSLPQNMRIGIITFGRTISIYDFSEGSVASADVLPGGNSPSEDSLKTLIYGTGIYLSPMHASLSVAHTIFSSLSPYRIKLPEVARDRCLGAAVEVAMAIIQGPSADMSRGIIKKPGGNSRILVCTGGPNTYGPGSVPSSLNHPNYQYMEKRALKWMEHLGQMAHRNNIIVDILCAGTCPVRVPVLQPLARSSGGVLLLHDDFGEAFGVNLQRAALRAAGSHGLFEIRCSDDILVTQVIGPGEEALADNHESFKNDSSYCIQMHCVEETQSFSLSMETKGDIQHDSVYFQFALRYWNAYQADISRVITVRLPTVDSVSQYLESIQEDVVSVLIAKRTLLHAKTAANAIDMRMTVDERIKDIASRFGLVQQKSKLLQFPKELSKLPEVLFHLRRGPLLGSIVGHEDERSVLRNIFLHASYELSLRMLAPRCLMHREGGTFEELPSYDLSMQSNAALVLDHGTDIFIWLGNELTADEVKSSAALAACLTLAEELSEQRFPAPKILSFREGSSQARYLASRLIPAHKDPPYEQEARFPQLQMLSSGQRARLKASFIHNDDPSFCEWMRSLKLVPPEPS